ncbi:hypothetical protein [Pectobacterium punjabense]|uniref:hypothetical protein n=1 Tax=Pectobacterium punjabense TaxID=2108399 RepID=UPI001BFFD44D|nr:hypothetical protein [Pectobacterium punjabense]MBT9186379.1 hypothetical protein [Pectobacterium punjabense]
MKHNPEIWLQAADDVANTFLSQSTEVRESVSNDTFNHIGIIWMLETLADAVYYINEPLCYFIRKHGDKWHRDGMKKPPEFAANWKLDTLSGISAP